MNADLRAEVLKLREIAVKAIDRPWRHVHHSERLPDILPSTTVAMIHRYRSVDSECEDSGDPKVWAANAELIAASANALLPLLAIIEAQDAELDRWSDWYSNQTDPRQRDGAASAVIVAHKRTDAAILALLGEGKS